MGCDHEHATGVVTDASPVEVTNRIRKIIAADTVVLFMKGTRQSPECGFSARVVDMLDEHVDDYQTVNVLASTDIREGIKAFSDWPTVPQLYVAGKFVGGADIVGDMHKTGELAALLGPKKETVVPEIFVSDEAVAAFRRFAENETPTVRIQIDRGFETELDIDEPKKTDVVLESAGLRLCLDAASARRADGLRIDFLQTEKGEGFKVENPNQPPKVQLLSATELAAMRTRNEPHLLLDVRGDDERDIANIEGSVMFTHQSADALEGVDPNMKLVIYCHHGMRSRVAAEHCLRLGFRNVFNLTGGIEQWSLMVDPKIARY